MDQCHDLHFSSSVMFGIGSAVEIQQLKNVILKRKIAFAVGMTSQYLVVPAAARLVVSALDMPVLHAFAIILIGCCPGGAVSNAFALFCKSRLFRRRESVRLGPASHLELKTVQEVWYCLFAPHYSLTIAASIAYTFSRLSINTTIDTNSERRCSLVHRHDHSVQHSGLCDAPTAIVYLDSGLSVDVEFKIPFLEIFYSLLMVLIPALCGFWLRANHPKGRHGRESRSDWCRCAILSSIFVGLT